MAVTVSEPLARAPAPDLPRRPWLALFVVTAAFALPTAGFGALLHGLGGGPLAPVLGPWAGHAIDHRCCTMATVWPTTTWALPVGAVFVALAIGFARRGAWRAFAPVLLGLWLLAWCGTAALSLVNATS